MDIGGTFTGVVTYDQQEGVFAASKASTTPGNLSEGVAPELHLRQLLTELGGIVLSRGL